MITAPARSETNYLESVPNVHFFLVVLKGLARLEKSDKILADVERDRHESVQQEEVVEELYHKVADEVAAPSQHLAKK